MPHQSTWLISHHGNAYCNLPQCPLGRDVAINQAGREARPRRPITSLIMKGHGYRNHFPRSLLCLQGRFAVAHCLSLTDYAQSWMKHECLKNQSCLLAFLCDLHPTSRAPIQQLSDGQRFPLHIQTTKIAHLVAAEADQATLISGQVSRIGAFHWHRGSRSVPPIPDITKKEGKQHRWDRMSCRRDTTHRDILHAPKVCAAFPR